MVWDDTVRDTRMIGYGATVVELRILESIVM